MKNEIIENRYYDLDLYNEIKSQTNLIAGEEYKKILFTIMKVASEIVSQTLGPYGATTIIEDSTTYATKDGWNTLNKVVFPDVLYNSIFNMIRQISFNLVHKVGDGTTSVIVIAEEFLSTIINSNIKYRQADILNIINKVKTHIIDMLFENNEIIQINKDGDYSDIYNIAYTSSNGNAKVAKAVQEIYCQTGNPNIYVDIDNIRDSITTEIERGYKFDCKVLNFKVYINSDGKICRKIDNKTLITVFDHTVTYMEHKDIIIALSNIANELNKEIIIAAPYFDDVITATIGSNIDLMVQKNAVPNIMLMQIPISMGTHRISLSDIMLLTNSTVFDHGKVQAANLMIKSQKMSPEHVEQSLDMSILKEEAFKQFTNVTDLMLSSIGKINEIIIGHNYAIIKEYDKIVNKDLYNITLESIIKDYEDAKIKADKSSSNLNKDYMEKHQRYIKFLGNMGSIHIGGLSDIEKICLKDSVDDTVLACRSAFNNGYVRGLGLSISSVIDTIIKQELSPRQVEERLVYEAFANGFRKLFDTVLRNKYGHGKNTADYDKLFSDCLERDYVYNIVNELYETKEGWTVTNSVSTDVEILHAVVGILSLILTSNQFLSMSRTFDRNHSVSKRKQEELNDLDAKSKVVIRNLIELIASKPEIIDNSLITEYLKNSRLDTTAAPGMTKHESSGKI